MPNLMRTISISVFAEEHASVRLEISSSGNSLKHSGSGLMSSKPNKMGENGSNRHIFKRHAPIRLFRRASRSLATAVFWAFHAFDRERHKHINWRSPDFKLWYLEAMELSLQIKPNPRHNVPIPDNYEQPRILQRPLNIFGLRLQSHGHPS